MTSFIAVKIHYDHRPGLPAHLKYSRAPTQAEYEGYLSLYRDEEIGGAGFHECLNFSIPEDGNALSYLPPGYLPGKARLDDDFVIFSFTYIGDRELGSRVVGVHCGVQILNVDGVERRDVPSIPGAEPLFFHAESPASLTTLLLPPVAYDVKAGRHIPRLKFWGNGLRNLQPVHAKRIIEDAARSATQSLPKARGSLRLVIERELEVLDAIRKRCFGGGRTRHPTLPTSTAATRTAPDQELGRLGESYVFQREQDNVGKLGLSPSAVEWVSQALPQAPYDIKTVRKTAHGELHDYYLEVKSSRIEGAANVYISLGQIQFMENNPRAAALAVITIDDKNNVTAYRELDIEQLRKEYSLVPIKYKLAPFVGDT